MDTKMKMSAKKVLCSNGMRYLVGKGVSDFCRAPVSGHLDDCCHEVPDVLTIERDCGGSRDIRT